MRVAPGSKADPAAAGRSGSVDYGLSIATEMKCFVGTELTTMTRPPNGICTTPLQLRAPLAAVAQPLVAR
jgi:hypothetical protein